MNAIAMKDLLEAGVHFGHQTKRWNPKMKPFLFAEKNGIHIIDLEKTMQCLMEARDAVREVATQGKPVLFVGTKPQAKHAIKEHADRCNMPYVTERWLGGTLTNFNTVRKSLSRLLYLEKMELDGSISQFSKKEINAVNEARRLRIPIVGVVDSNADPEEVNYPVPGNDDAMRAISLFAGVVADACIEGRSRFTEGRDVSSGDAPVAVETTKSVA